MLIDDERNDIYIHIDKKVKNFDFVKYKNICKKSTVHYTKKRYDVKWGESSQVKTEMLLFETAYRTGYDYYHLISGSDMPIKSQNYIHNFFKNNRYEFIELAPGEQEKYRFRLSRYHITSTKPILKRVSFYFDILQDKLKIDRLRKTNIKIYKGSNWASLSHKCVGFLLKNKYKIKKMTWLSLCADEVYKQTIILNSQFKENVYPYEDIRLIDWDRYEGTSPHTFTVEDYEMIKNSKCLFARKFIYEKDSEIIDKVFSMVKDA